MGAGMYTGYTRNAFNTISAGEAMPSNNILDYTQGSDGLYYFHGYGAQPVASGTGAEDATSAAASAAAGAAANQLIQSGTAAVENASTAAATNLSTVQNMIGSSTAQSNADLNKARSAGASLTQTAGTLGGIANTVLDTANQVGATADIFGQYAASMQQASTFAQANALPWIQTGNDLLSMNPNATGIAGEWNKQYAQMSPDALAAGAATDTRKAASVAEGDMLRAMARRGISAGSGALTAALGKMKEREESSVAAMMTSARKVGLSLQSEALRNGLTMALSASGMGKTFADEAITATAAAASATGQAASALNNKGSLQAQAAGIVATQGNLFNAAGNLALGISSNVTNGAASGASALTAATNTTVNAQQVAADYYSTQGGSLLSMLTQQKYNVLTALFGTT